MKKNERDAIREAIATDEGLSRFVQSGLLGAVEMADETTRKDFVKIFHEAIAELPVKDDELLP